MKNEKIKKEDFEVNEKYNEKEIIEIIENFDNMGQFVADHGRNIIKKFPYENLELNVKKFQKKGTINKLYYKYFVGSKAKRSYNYGKKLLEKNIKNPEPIAYFDNFFVKEEKEYRSFYMCKQINYDFTCRELLWNEKLVPEVFEKLNGKEQKIIEQFSKFTYDLHEAGVKFDDYSPGNVLIKEKKDGNYDFYLVDLNRMKFLKQLTFNQRMENVSRMMEDKKFIEMFSREYSKYYKEKREDEISKKLTYYIKKHNFLLWFKDNTRDFRRKIFKKNK